MFSGGIERDQWYESNPQPPVPILLSLYYAVLFKKKAIPARIYLLKVNNRNTKTMRRICSKLIISTTERRQ